MQRGGPKILFDATGAGASLLATLWPAAGPSTYTVTLPQKNQAQTPQALLNGTTTIGGVFAPGEVNPAYLLDFAAVGSAEATLTIEVGKLYAQGAIAMPMASITLVTDTNTVANVNPFTGAATASKTWNLFDTTTITAADNTDAIIALQNGTTADVPVQLKLFVDDASFYYIIITNLGGLTEILCCYTPSGVTRLMTKALP